MQDPKPATPDTKAEPDNNKQPAKVSEPDGNKAAPTVAPTEHKPDTKQV